LNPADTSKNRSYSGNILPALFKKGMQKNRRYFSMTNAGDVIKQVETTLNDTQYPPTLRQKEILTMIRYQVFRESAEPGVNR
jgi:hypothetical protein